MSCNSAKKNASEQGPRGDSRSSKGGSQSGVGGQGQPADSQAGIGADSRPRSFFTSIGAKLTLWGTLITLLICATVCVLLYLGLSFSLHREVDGFLEGEVQEFSTVLIEEEDDSLEEIVQDIRQELSSRIRGDLTVRLLDASGRLRASSNQADRLPDPWPMPRDAPKQIHEPWYQTVKVNGIANPIRVCSQWTRLPDGTLQLAQATYVLNRLAASLNTFRNICIAAMLVAAVLSLIGGRLLARRSLRPMHRMTLTARHIGASRLAQRLERSGNGDELDRLAETLNAMLSRIERQVRRIQQFTADAAHELRTPLAVLRGNAEVALTSSRDGQALRQVVEESIDQYDHLTRIADDLLLLARLDAGEAILLREPVQLDKMVHDVIDLYSPYTTERRIELAIGACEPVKLPADEERLRQVLSNLIDNSIKYMGGPGRIDVSLTRANGEAQLTVADTGPGMPEEDIPHVFDRFYRVDRARSRRGQRGAGLGLPICRSIVEAHGGHIDITSSPGGGTSVAVAIALDRCVDQQARVSGRTGSP